jgi:hypothetical protein
MTTARAFLLLQAAALCGLLSCTSAPAQQPPARLQEQYTHTAWSALDSAPVDILNIAQTSDGWLWLAAGTGLYRFDGRRYERMDSVEGHALLSSNVRTLYAPPEGGLWVGYRMGGGISYFHNHQARHYRPARACRPAPSPASCARRTACCGWRRATAWRGWTATASSRSAPKRACRSGARAGAVRPRGRQWVAMQGGAYSRADAQSPFLPWPQGDFSGLTLAPDGTVWASDADNYYRMLPAAPGATPPHGRRSAAAICITTAMAPVAVPRRRAGTAQRQRRRRRAATAGPERRPAAKLFQDREGNVWIGTSAGLNRFRRNRLLTMPLQAVFNHPAIAPAAAASGPATATARCTRWPPKASAQRAVRPPCTAIRTACSGPATARKCGA